MKKKLKFLYKNQMNKKKYINLILVFIVLLAMLGSTLIILRQLNFR